MKQKLIYFHLFLFYILFIISFFNSNGYNNYQKYRYVAILLLSIFSFCLFLKENKHLIYKKFHSSSILYVNLIMYIILLFLITFSQYGIISLIKYLSLIYLFILTYLIIPYLINIIGLIKHNNIVITSIFISIIISYILNPHGYVYNNGTRLGANQRLTLNFDLPNTLGVFCFIALILIVYNCYITKITIYKILLSCFFLYFLYQSNSRTSLYSTIIFISLLIYFTYMQKHKLLAKILNFIGIIFILCAILYIQQNIPLNFINIILSNRIYYTQLAFSNISHSYALFTGLGSFTNSSINQLNIVLLDSSYFNIIYQNGLIGLFFILLMIITLFIISIKKYHIMNSITQKHKQFIKTFFITFLIFSVFENTLFNISLLLPIIFYSIVYYFIRYNTNYPDSQLQHN
jgi:hypothetical protein